MATDNHSNRREWPIVVDLTADSDSESEDEAATVPSVSLMPGNALRSQGTPQTRATPVPTATNTLLTNRPATAVTAASLNHRTTTSTDNAHAQSMTATTSGGSNNIKRSAKRRKLSTTSGSGTSTNPNSLRAKLNNTNDTPSISSIKAALKPSASSIPALDNLPAQAARPLFIGRLPDKHVATGLPSPGLTTPESVSGITIESDPLTFAGDETESAQPPLVPQDNEALTEIPTAIAPTIAIQERPPLRHASPQERVHAIETIKQHGAIATLPTRQSTPRTLQKSPAPSSPHAPVLPLMSTTDNPPQSKHTGTAAERTDHLLIFLKEVKKLKWADITTEFSKDIPGRTYSQLQSHYSSVLNKRDRTQDPPSLNLPPRFAAEATIDWPTVHASTGPTPARKEVSAVRDTNFLRKRHANKPRAVNQVRYDGDSSGTDSMPAKRRARRAPPVDYTWPQLRTVHGGCEDSPDANELTHDPRADFREHGRSQSPSNELPVTTSRSNIFRAEPLAMDFQSHDAELGLVLQKDLRATSQNQTPYLSSLQRRVMRESLGNWTWDQQSIQDWRSVILHVDFGPAELQTVENVVAKFLPSGRHTRHRTHRRHLRSILKNLAEPKLKMLTHEIGRHLRSRNAQSIASFLEDAAAGKISDAPQIQRLASVKPIPILGSDQPLPIPSRLRQRELGLLMRRGRHTATSPLTYQLKNQISDTLGPMSAWTGASSDIHTVAWSPGGQNFAAGAVAVTDVDSMQYNRPNVLMYGDTTSGNIHELGKHYVKRPKTDAGANSTHAMFVSQDPRLYTTVTSVAFSPSGRLMYSAGYDHSVCIWDVAAGSKQPQLVRELGHQAPIDCLAVNPNFAGIIATATKRTTEKSIKLVNFDEDRIDDEPWQPLKANFASAKAMSRPDLKMSANTLNFDPTGRLLLAGFGANMREDSGLDTSGDICLWDVETQTALQVHGSSRNVFDVAFNAVPRQRGVFAVGCVANGNVNRGTRSVVRCYSPTQSKYTCPLELECKAFDMNDVVWCPYDENLIAAGCTDGRSYTWDLRMPSRVLYTLSHGKSLMPLQDGVSHERTDTGVRFLSWGPNARRLYSGSSDGVVKVWDVTQSQEEVFIKDLITTNSGIMSGEFTADYSKLVLGEVNGTANVLEVGRDDVALKDAYRLTYCPYEHSYDDYDDDESSADAMIIDPPLPEPTDIAATEARTWLETGQLRMAPMGGLPKQQVIQGPNYKGPFDRSEDVYTQSLREAAVEFQLNMAVLKAPQCSLSGCADNINTTTYEEIGDSGRSLDRIPDEMRRQWLDETPRVVPGKSKCTICSRPAIPAVDGDRAFCERCSFSCFRCGVAGAITQTTSTLECGYCEGVWDIGALGYESCQQSAATGKDLSVPALKRFGKESYLERLEDEDTAFGDEMNALTDYYFGLAIDRPESPPL